MSKIRTECQPTGSKLPLGEIGKAQSRPGRDYPGRGHINLLRRILPWLYLTSPKMLLPESESEAGPLIVIGHSLADTGEIEISVRLKRQLLLREPGCASDEANNLMRQVRLFEQGNLLTRKFHVHARERLV